MKILFFDVETTGVDYKQNGIHQISGCIEIDGVIMENFNFKVAPNPAAKIEDEALKVGNVTLEQIQAYSPMATVFTQFKEMLSKYCDKFNKKDKFFLCGFNNASFDNQFLRAWFGQNGDSYFGSWFWANSLDAFILATQKLLNERADMPNFQLKTVCKAMDVLVDESRLHDAEYDIELTRELYYTVIK